MADATEYNVRWPLYDPPSSPPPLCSNGGKKSVLLRPRPRVRRGRRREAAIRHAPGRWSVTSAVEWRERGRESLLDVRQRRTSMLRGKCGVTSPRVVNSQELSCTQKRTRDKANSPLLKPLSRSAPIAIRDGKTDNVLINGNFTLSQ